MSSCDVLFIFPSLQIDMTLHPHARASRWKKTNIVELKNFFGLVFYTGIVRLPQLHMYWSTNPNIGQPVFRRTMSRNRFQLLTSVLHFAHGGDAAVDKMWRLRPFLDSLLGNFQKMFKPRRAIAVDEGCLLWRGRLEFKTYNPRKPVKYSIKSYILCDSVTAYCYNLKPYTAQHWTLVETVTWLLSDLKQKGYHLYKDTFYNSLNMSTEMLKLQTHTCGTLRRNRGEPEETDVTQKQLGVGERITRHNGRLIVTSWNDHKLTKILSTIHQDSMVEVMERPKGQAQRQKKMRPAAVCDYNKYMKGKETNQTYFRTFTHRQWLTRLMNITENKHFRANIETSSYVILYNWHNQNKTEGHFFGGRMFILGWVIDCTCAVLHFIVLTDMSYTVLLFCRC